MKPLRCIFGLHQWWHASSYIPRHIYLDRRTGLVRRSICDAIIVRICVRPGCRHRKEAA